MTPSIDRLLQGPRSRSWRKEHGSSMLASWAVGFAATALMAFIAAAALLLSNAILLPGAGVVRLLLAVFIGPLAAALSAVVLLYRAGRLSAPAALFTAAVAVPACVLAALAAASWTVGFEEADAGPGRSWFGSATLLFLIPAWMAGTGCLVPAVGSALNNRRSLATRLVQSTLLAAPLALILGASMLMAPMIWTLGAIVLLVVALREGGADPPASPHGVVRAEMQSSPLSLTAAWTRRRNVAAGAAALVTLIVGLCCAVFALTGSNWAPGVTDSTHAMNLGLAAGALATIPAAVAAGVVLHARFGSVMPWSPLLCCAGLVVAAAAQFLGAGHPAQWPLTLAAATLMGFAVALPFGRLVRGGRALRSGVTALFGLAASIVGLSLVTMAAFIAPPAAAVLFIWSMRRLWGQGQQPGPRLLKP